MRLNPSGEKTGVEVETIGLRVVGNVQHDPETIDSLAACALLIEQSGHVAVFAWQTELPSRQLRVEVAILLLPLLDVGEGTNVNRLLEEAVDLRKDADDFDVVTERA